LQSVVTVCTVTPAIPPVIADAAAGIIAASGIPILITYTNGINIMEVYSDKLLEISQKHASLTWGLDHSQIKLHESFVSSPKLMQSQLLLVDSLLLERK
jgi:hypothetical protein